MVTTHLKEIWKYFQVKVVDEIQCAVASEKLKREPHSILEASTDFLLKEAHF